MNKYKNRQNAESKDSKDKIAKSNLKRNSIALFGFSLLLVLIVSIRSYFIYGAELNWAAEYAWTSKLQWLTYALLNVGFVSLVPYLFYRCSLVSPEYWFRKKVFTKALLVLLLLYDFFLLSLAIVNLISDAPILDVVGAFVGFLIVPFLTLLYILSMFIKRR